MRMRVDIELPDGMPRGALADSVSKIASAISFGATAGDVFRTDIPPAVTTEAVPPIGTWSMSDTPVPGMR